MQQTQLRMCSETYNNCWPRYILSELDKMFGREPTHIPMLASVTAVLLMDACASLRTLQEVRGQIGRLVNCFAKKKLM